jgi:hypothetical protein
VQFNSCNGLAWSTRVRNTYTCTSGYRGRVLRACLSSLLFSLVLHGAGGLTERGCPGRSIGENLQAAYSNNPLVRVHDTTSVRATGVRVSCGRPPLTRSCGMRGMYV